MATRGPIQQRVTHGARDFINRRIGGGDIQQPALAFIKRQALCFDLQSELRDFQPGGGRALSRRAASIQGTLRVCGIQQPGACPGDVPLAIGLAHDTPRAFGLVHGGVADARASCDFARGGCQFSHGGDLPPRVGEESKASVSGAAARCVECGKCCLPVRVVRGANGCPNGWWNGRQRMSVAELLELGQAN